MIFIVWVESTLVCKATQDAGGASAGPGGQPGPDAGHEQTQSSESKVEDVPFEEVK